jgi:hypothetical protein
MLVLTSAVVTCQKNCYLVEPAISSRTGLLA